MCCSPIDISGSVRGGNISYVISIAASARRHVSGWSAATAAIGSPMYRTTSKANTGWSSLMSPYVNCPGTSEAVMMASTPVTFHAFDKSMETIRACG